MKTIFILSLAIFLTCFSSIAQDPTETHALGKVLVTDMSNNPSKGDRILFIGIRTAKIVEGMSGSDGRFSVLLPKGDTYEIRCMSFEGDYEYSSVEIPDEPGLMTFEAQIMYELPKVYTLENVYFDTGKSTLRPESFVSLDQLAELMKSKQSLKIEIAGHTDDIGEDHTNQLLSENRAKAVRMYIVRQGVSPDRITAVGYGESSPVALNVSEEGRQKNRRTEVHILAE